MINSLMRKFSFRNRTSRNEQKTSAVKKTSSAIIRLVRSFEKLDVESPYCQLPPDIIVSIIDRMSFFDQLRMQGVCKHLQGHFQQKIRMITKLVIRKQDIDKATSSDGPWDRHCREYVAIRLTHDTAHIVIDEHWTNRDLYVLLSTIQVFHEWVEEVEMDAPIAELIVVSLSEIPLERWYTFQCLMKAFNNFDDDFHMDGDFIQDRETYWPCVRELTIRTKASQANHLARVLDYGVKSGYVMDRRTMNKLRIVFADMATMNNKIVNKHIYHFRCWAGSLGWDHRYETQFLGTA